MTLPRLVAGLLYLEHTYRLLDEAAVARCVENLYYQHFGGETLLQHRFALDPSSLTRWRKRMGEEGMEWLLTKTIEAGREAGVISERSIEAVFVDAIVMEKAMANPTDARLYEKACRRLVALAQKSGLLLWQSYARLAPRLPGQVGRYAHARQFKRMRKALRRLKGCTGRVMQDIQRQLGSTADSALRQRIEAEIALMDRLLGEKPKDKRKLYALHEPEVDCISKGKARVRYEFGTKVSVATIHKEGFVIGMRPMSGNPYDGHTLREALEQVKILTDIRPKRAFVDRGYRGHGVQTTAVCIAGQKRGMTPALRHDLRRRSAIEPAIGHMKTDGRLNPLRSEGHARRRASRCPLWLRPQHPDDPFTPPSALGRNPDSADGDLQRDQRFQTKGNCRQGAPSVMFRADYKQCNGIEIMFGRLKYRRLTATRYVRCAKPSLLAVALATAAVF